MRKETMGSDENVAIMQRAYGAFNTGDMNTLTELMDETVWHLPGRSSMAGNYEGRGATLAYFGQLAQETGGTFRAELQHMAADGDDHVVGIQRSTADRNGKHLDVACCIVFELKDGKVTDGREHFEGPLRMGRVLVLAPPARARQRSRHGPRLGIRRAANRHRFRTTSRPRRGLHEVNRGPARRAR
jgi:ketosteroid isomerase-like protein